MVCNIEILNKFAMSRKNKKDENKEGNASMLAYLNEVVAGISSRR